MPSGRKFPGALKGIAGRSSDRPADRRPEFDELERRHEARLRPSLLGLRWLERPFVATDDNELTAGPN